MIKQLHFLVLSVLMITFGMSASAQDVVTFTFNEANSYEQFGLKGWSCKVDDVDVSDGDITENKSITAGDVTFTVTPASGNTPTRMYKDYNGNYALRTYGGSQIIISSTKNIASIEFGSNKFKFSTSAGKLNGTKWTSEEAIGSVEFDCSKSSTIETVTVTLGEGGSTPDPDPTPDPEPTETVAENIAAFKALCVKDGADVTLKLTDAKVLYVNEWTSKGNDNQEIYLLDATGAIMTYNLGLAVKDGDVINGSIKCVAKDFYGTPEVCKGAETNADGLTIEAGSLANPETMTIDQINEDALAKLVNIQGVEMISKVETDNKGKEHTNYYLKDAAGNELRFYNKFHVEGFDAKDYENQTDLSFVGILKLDFGNITLCPIDPVHTGIDCIENVELNVNAPMFNVSGQKVNSSFKGIVIQNGKKFMNK